MQKAINQAYNAWALREIPIGAVVVRNGEIIATGFNQSISSNDPTAHAEIIAIRAAAAVLGNYRLPGCEIYTTLEPCVMCAGAMMHARLSRVIFGASDPKIGACGSVLNLFDQEEFNHHTELIAGILAKECGAILRDFFIELRQIKKRKRL